MLPPDLIKKIKRVHIRSGRAVNTMMAGQYKSVFRGVGIEFEEVRDYSPGDDVKNIDWKVSARMGRPYVKLYREEREMIVMLLVDLSASGRFGTQTVSKQEIAAETAAILAFNAVRNNDKVGAILFTDQVEHYIPPKKGSGHVWRVIKEIFTYTPHHRGTDISAAVGFLGRVCRKRSTAFVISDFIQPRIPSMADRPSAMGRLPKADRSSKMVRLPIVDRQMRSTARKHELIHVVISDPGEFELPPGGIITMQDLETGSLVQLDAFHGPTRRRYSAQRRAVYQAVLDEFKSADMDAVEISTVDSAADALTRYFHMRERRKR